MPFASRLYPSLLALDNTAIPGSHVQLQVLYDQGSLLSVEEVATLILKALPFPTLRETVAI